VTRLLDMGLESFNVSSALNLVVAQRLLRRLCGQCRVRYTPSEDEFRALKTRPDATLRELRFTEQALADLRASAPREVKPHLEPVTLDTPIAALPYFRGQGCDACNGSGLKGRQGIYEVMFMSPALRKLILRNVGATEIHDAAIAGGMLTLRMDGLVKVWKGLTNLEQVVRETNA
jgi:type IV pilus assembly protein PilB